MPRLLGQAGGCLGGSRLRLAPQGLLQSGMARVVLGYNPWAVRSLGLAATRQRSRPLEATVRSGLSVKVCADWLHLRMRSLAEIAVQLWPRQGHLPVWTLASWHSRAARLPGGPDFGPSPRGRTSCFPPVLQARRPLVRGPATVCIDCNAES